MAKTPPLTNTEVKQAKPKDKLYKLADGDGLQLRSKPNGTKTWLLDFINPYTRKRTRQDRPTENEEWLTFADDGYKGLFSAIKTPMRDSSSKVIGMLGGARDITTRKCN